MVTETSRLEAEAPPTTEAPSLQEAEDSPLIPQEIEEPESEAEGTETPTDGAQSHRKTGRLNPKHRTPKRRRRPRLREKSGSIPKRNGAPVSLPRTARSLPSARQGKTPPHQRP